MLHSVRLAVVLPHLLVLTHFIISGQSYIRHSQSVRTWLDGAKADISWMDQANLPESYYETNPPFDAFKPNCGQFQPLANEQFKSAFGCSQDLDGQSRLSGGFEVAANNAPYYAQSIGLFQKGSQIDFQNCGGTIVHKNLILTAAHCVNSTGTKLVKLGYIVGANEFVFKPNMTEPKHDGRFVQAAKVFIHPKYSGDQIEYPTYDIAIVKLAGDLVYNERVQPACLTFERAPRNDARCFVAARGNINVQKEKPKSLMAFMVSLDSGSYDKPDAESLKWYAHARGNNCHGDSGSGLICYDDCGGRGMRGYLVGVASAVKDTSVCDINDRKDPTNYMNPRGLRISLLVLMLNALLALP